MIIEGFQRGEGGAFFVSGFVLSPEKDSVVPVQFLFDTGADVTILSFSDALKLDLDVKKFKKIELVAFGGAREAYIFENVHIAFLTGYGSFYSTILPKILVLSSDCGGVPSILGRDALTDFIIEFDPAQRKLYLRTRPKSNRKSKRLRCFLSYNRRDKTFVRKLALDLDKNRVDVWFDEWKIKPGDSITVSIGDGLKKYNNFVLIMTPNSMASTWVDRELSVTLFEYNSSRKRGQKRIKIIPALLKECSTPLWLRDIKYVDFRRDYKKSLRELLNALI